MPHKTPTYIFYTIIISQFCCTSLWFAVNAVLQQAQTVHNWPVEALGYVTSSVQLGFIIGTLTFSLLGLSDRFSPSFIFFLCSILAAGLNALYLADAESLNLTLFSRFATGFFLAGVYPVGMKIASDWKQEGLGHWLGALVGALVLGTAFPHVLKLVPGFIEPAQLIIAVSLLASLGGLIMILLVKDGPFRKPAQRFSFSDVRDVFRTTSFKAPAFGYFGHMWELYAFWAFVPVILLSHQNFVQYNFSLPLWSFVIIASGFLGCVIGGKLSLNVGSKPIAGIALASSALCCLISPVLFQTNVETFLAFMMFWGFMVVADSPQFSALVAFHAPAHIRGSAITITTCIGFAITIVSIQLLNLLQQHISPRYLLLLLTPGPLLGLIWLYPLKKTSWKK